MIPSHVAQLGPALRPALTILDDALAGGNFAPSAEETSLAKNPALVIADFSQAVRSFVEAGEGLTTHVVSLSSCTPARVRSAADEVRDAAEELARVYRLAARLSLAGGGSRNEETLTLAIRDTLVTIAHWLADLMLVIAEPWKLLDMGGETMPDGNVSIELQIKLRYPDAVDDLPTWLPARLAYRQDSVTKALRLALRPRAYPTVAAVSGVATPPASAKCAGTGFFGSLVFALIGIAAIDSIFDDD
ncbi:MAG: hypothetical protein Q8O25_17120 [Sulfurisoma sp.]|nr:hypothetical protein [Sulfurisoma sp.]